MESVGAWPCAPTFMDKKNRLKQLLLQLSYERKQVTLSSGKTSDFYFDGRQTALHPEGASLLGELLFEMIQSFPSPVEAVGGPTLGADPLVTAMSLTSYRRQKPIPAFIVRKEPKGHGHSIWIEGLKNLRRGMRVVIVEDVITTGKSSLVAVERAQAEGFHVIGIMAVIDREEGGREAIEESGYPLKVLFTKSELIS